MSATAAAILHWNCVPVFADINEKYYCIDVESVKKLITKKTKAIITVDIFGQSSDLESLQKICDENDLYLICDSAQSPGAIRNGYFAGTTVDIGGISLNYHKHIHCGEGGVIFTDDDDLALRMRLIRNHGEVVINQMPLNDLPKNTNGIIGHNFRLGEIEASITREQLKKLDKLTNRRSEIARRLYNGLSNLHNLHLPEIDLGNSHVFYMFPIRLEGRALDIGRDKISQTLTEFGLFPLEMGYENLHLLPIYSNQNAYGTSKFPWVLDECFKPENYMNGACPVAEKLNNSSLILIPLCVYELDDFEVDLVVNIFKMTWEELHLI
jgi:dTDP-4-amino-4,6-dideoxygalactose transaminase